METKYQELENEKIEIMEKRNKKEEEGLDINQIIKKAWHFKKCQIKAPYRANPYYQRQ